MTKFRKIKFSLIAIVIAGLIVGAGTYMAVPTFAQESDKTVKETPINKFLSKVASILGIQEETLTSAMDQAKQEIQDESKEEVRAKLQASVENGELTQEQADERLEGFKGDSKKGMKSDKNNNGFGKSDKDGDIRSQIRGRKPNPLAKPEFDIEKIQEELKKAVDDGEITQEQADERLKRLEESGGRPGWPARGGHFDPEAMKARIQQAVDSGEITQEQADERLKGLQESGGRPGWPPGRGNFDPEAMKARIQHAVDSGIMTQEQADEWLKGLEAPTIN